LRVPFRQKAIVFRSAQSDHALHIDIPVKLDKANVVFDIGHLVLNGDVPFFTGDMDLLVSDLADWKVKGEVIVPTQWSE
jgi:hypothetical protein